MKTKPKITLFYCINAFKETTVITVDNKNDYNLNVIKMACSGMTKDIYILKAFEAGADAVLVFVCPEGTCRNAEGNIRATKRVEWIKNLLDEIGINGKRVSIHSVSFGDENTAKSIIDKSLDTLAKIGPNPASLKNGLNRKKMV